MNTTVCRMTVTGEALTRLVRDIFLSEKPNAAYRALVATLGGGEPGEAEHYATKVLDGVCKLVGDEGGINVVPDDNEEYRAQIKVLYAGRVKIDNQWMRPTKRVTDLGDIDVPEDFPRIPTDLGETRASLTTFSKARMAFYGKPGTYVYGRILFEPCGELPHWWPELSTPQQALDQYLASGRTLEEVGYSQTYKRTSCTKPGGVVNMANGLNRLDIDAMTKRARREEDAEDDRVRAEKYELEVKSIRERVLAQCAGDTFPLAIEDKVYDVPRAPFYQWALRSTPLAHLAPQWTPISSSGMKLGGDDPFHSDWMIGAGIDLAASYNGAVRDVTLEKHDEIQREVAHFEVGVLVSGPSVHGIIGDDVIVLPDLHPDHLEKIVNARAIITERGGKLAHLALVATGRNIPVLRVSDAMTIFRKGMVVHVSPEHGRVDVLEGSCRDYQSIQE